MLRYILKRVASGVVLLVAISTIAFFLMSLGSGDVGRERLGMTATQEQVDRFNDERGLNDPIFTRYVTWVKGAVQGDLGDSWFGAQSVIDTIRQRATVTLTLIVGSLLVASLLAVALGVVAALKGGVTDRLVQLVGVVGFAVPGFIIAFGLVILLAIEYPIFRATGYVRPSDSIGGWLRSITLPIVALAAASLAALSMQVRGAVRDTLGLDFVRTLRSRGLSERQVIFKHVLRNSAGPALSILGVQFIGLFGGAVIIEQVFAIQGLGQVAVSSASAGDVPVVMGVVVFTAVVVVVVNLAVDLANAWLNPKVRLT